MNDPYLLWAIGLMTLALVLTMLELFLPSGGMIGIGAGCCVLVALFCFYKHDTSLGLIMTLVTILSVPGLILFGMKVMPHTPVGRMLTLSNPDGAEERSHAGSDEHPLVGRQGTALTDLRPIGTCIIDGKRTECLSDAGLIEEGATVRVVAADGMQIKVREERG